MIDGVIGSIAGILFFVVWIILSIGLHEIGHMVPAKRFGVKVTQYMIGFGPTLWSRTRGDTEYGVKGIPLGGYIRMIGMFPPRRDDADGTVRTSSTGAFSQLIDDARTESLQQVGPGDQDRVFYKLPVRQKLVIMLGGPFMNLVIAVVLTTGVALLYGVLVTQPVISQVVPCVTSAPPTVAAPVPACTTTDPASPAAAAGLQAGDRVTVVDSVPVTQWKQVTDAIIASKGEPVALTIERAGATQDLTITPATRVVPVYDDRGRVTKDANGALVTRTVPFLGVAPTVTNEPQSIGEVPGLVWDGVWRTAGVIAYIPEKMVGVVQTAFGLQERDPDGPISVVGVGRLTAEVGGADLGEDALANKLAIGFSIVASLNFALFVFNLIPLLPLDGGHVAGALWEGLRRRLAALRGRPDPGYVDVARALPLAYGVALALMLMSGLLIYVDIVNPIRLFG